MGRWHFLAQTPRALRAPASLEGSAAANTFCGCSRKPRSLSETTLLHSPRIDSSSFQALAQAVAVQSSSSPPEDRAIGVTDLFPVSETEAQWESQLCKTASP